MRQIIKAFMLSAILLGIFTACTNNNENEKKKVVSDTYGPSPPPIEQNNNNQQEANLPEHPGKAVFAKYCLVCHQADGSGVPGMHPPLGPGSWVDKDPNELIAILMKGLSGKVEVNGEIYNSFMPSQAQLTDEEIAAVLSYIR